ALDLVQVGGAVGERVGAPGEEEHVLDGAQREQIGGDVRGAEDEEAAVGLLDRAAEVAGDLLGRDFLQPGLDGGVERRQLGGGAGHGSLKRGKARPRISPDVAQARMNADRTGSPGLSYSNPCSSVPAGPGRSAGGP